MNTHKTFSTPLRSGFTLIELIFSLIVISIVLLSFPQLFKMSQQHIEEAIKIEAVNELYTVQNGILTYYWDEKTPNDDNTTFYILDVKNGDDELSRLSSSSIYRKNGFEGTTRRHFDDTTREAIDTLGPDSGENSISDYDDSDDFNNMAFTVNKNIGDYIIAMEVNIKVSYVDDGKIAGTDYSKDSIDFTLPTSPQSQSTNIKMIEVTIKNKDNGEKIIVGRNYICNLGAPKLFFREF